MAKGVSQFQAATLIVILCLLSSATAVLESNQAPLRAASSIIVSDTQANTHTCGIHCKSSSLLAVKNGDRDFKYPKIKYVHTSELHELD